MKRSELKQIIREVIEESKVKDKVIEEAITEFDFKKGFKIKTPKYELICEPLKEGYKGRQYTYGIIKFKNEYDRDKKPVTKIYNAIEKALYKERIDFISLHIGVTGYFNKIHHHDVDLKTMYLEIEFKDNDAANKHLSNNFKEKLDIILNDVVQESKVNQKYNTPEKVQQTIKENVSLRRAPHLIKSSQEILIDWETIKNILEQIGVDDQDLKFLPSRGWADYRMMDESLSIMFQLIDEILQMMGNTADAKDAISEINAEINDILDSGKKRIKKE